MNTFQGVSLPYYANLVHRAILVTKNYTHKGLKAPKQSR